MPVDATIARLHRTMRLAARAAAMREPAALTFYRAAGAPSTSLYLIAVTTAERPAHFIATLGWPSPTEEEK